MMIYDLYNLYYMFIKESIITYTTRYDSWVCRLFLEGRHLASDSLTESVQPRLDTKSRQYEDFEKPKCSEILKHFRYVQIWFSI